MKVYILAAMLMGMFFLVGLIAMMAVAALG